MAPRDDTAIRVTGGPQPRLFEDEDIGEVLAEAGRANFEYIQLEPVSGSSRLLLGEMGGLKIMSLRVPGAIVFRSSSAAGDVTIQFDVGSIGSARHNGQLLSRNDIVIFSGSPEY